MLKDQWKIISSLTNRSGLLNKEQNDEVSDTTDDDRITKADYIKETQK
jgi:hypothetical protein